MLKTLKNLFKQDKEKFVVPKSVQSVIPIKTIWEDGIFLVGKNKYAKTFKFEDINYAVASREDKEAMFLEYSELLNSLDSGATTKITINNRRLNKADFEQTILIPMADDGLDKYRKEYNKMLLEKATGANSIVQDKYVTVSVSKKNIEEARNYFARVGADLIAHFSRLGSRCVELEAEEKLRIFHDFYRTGEETAFRFDISQTMRKGHDFKDFICPDTFEFENDCFRMGDRYGRVIFLREYAAYIKDSMVAELCELNRNMMLSVDIKGLTQEQLGEKLGVTNKTISRWENGNYMPDVEMLSLLSKEFGVSINELISGERLWAEDFKKAADDNLVTALNNSTFTLKEKIVFFKKKWLHEHISTIVLCVVAWIGIIIWTALKLRGSDSYALLGAIGSMLAILFYVVLYNRMMVYVENHAYRATPDKETETKN